MQCHPSVMRPLRAHTQAAFPTIYADRHKARAGRGRQQGAGRDSLAIADTARLRSCHTTANLDRPHAGPPWRPHIVPRMHDLLCCAQATTGGHYIGYARHTTLRTSDNRLSPARSSALAYDDHRQEAGTLHGNALQGKCPCSETQHAYENEASGGATRKQLHK